VRRLALPSAVLELPTDIDKAYVVDIVLVGGAMHSDGFSTVSMREVWICDTAT